MKNFTTLRWLGCLFIVCAGGLFSCDGGRKNEEGTTREVASSNQIDTMEEESEIDETAPLNLGQFKPKEGAGPKDLKEYNNSLKAIRTYREKRPKKHIHDVYFNKERAYEILKQDGVVGLRIYRADKSEAKGKPDVVIVIVGVDEKGNDVKVPPGPNKEVGNYMIGISAEKCPANCEDQTERCFEQ